MQDIDDESEDEFIFERQRECCIYKVPEDIRMLNEEAYTPQMVSIGPIHRKNSRLKKMEEEKKRYKKNFILRTNKDMVKEFRRYIRSEKARIYASYDDNYFEDGSFENIILIDVIFIFEFFLGYDKIEENLLLHTPRLKGTIRRDLLLLENQIPFFVLEELFAKLRGFVTRNLLFLNLALEFLYGRKNGHSTNSLNIKHFTDLNRCVLLEQFQPPQCPLPRGDSSYKDVSYIPCATKLQASGVEFAKCDKEENRSLIEIRYRYKAIPMKLLPIIQTQQLVLHIPPFEIDDFTESVIRNVMALEQLYYPRQTHICSFVVLMDFLIDTDKDVDLLVEKGILSHLLGDNAAIASMFNKLGLQIGMASWCYSGIAKELEKHNKKRWNHAKASLKSVYFRDRWTGTATVAAALLLILTFIQTVCSILQVVTM